jgi:hypothetical protein
MTTTGEGFSMKISSVVCAMVLLGAAASVTPLLPTPVFGQTVAKTAGISDAQGQLHVPNDYRTAYQFVGTWAIANDNGPASKQIHNVYASPGTIEAFRQTGKFPDDAVLIKEVFDTATAQMTTGNVSHVDKLQGWFVMQKDSKNSHSGNKLRGDGWGWSWFDAKNPMKTTSTDYHTDCQGCHAPAQKTDWIYTQGYAPLRK